MIKRDDVHKAIDDGLLEAIKDRVQREATNEITEPGQTAEDQFENGLRILKDAHDRAHSVVEKIFPE
jgi:hypothetical protein